MTAALAALVVLSVLGPASALAGKPDLTVTGNAAPGTAEDTGQTAQPSVVSVNDTVQFTTSIKNRGTSNVSQLFFDTSTLPSGATVNKITADRAGCSLTTTPLCTFGALRSGESIRVTIIFTTPTPTAANPAQTSCRVGSNGYQGATVTATGTSLFCVDLRWFANGAPTSDGGTSFGDFFDWFDFASLNTDAINFHGRFVYLNGQKVVANSMNVSTSNKQGTQASVNDLNIPVTVEDGPNVLRIACVNGSVALTAGGTFDCTTLTSETSEVNVKNSNVVNVFPLLVKFYQGPANLKGSKPVALHQYLDALTGATVTETISNTCILAKDGTPTATSPIPCLVVGNGAKQVTIWNDHNGKYNF